MKHAALLALFFFSPAFSQMPRGFAWWDMPIARDLKLSEEQNSQIKVIVREYRSRLIDLHASEQKAGAEFDDLINDDNVDLNRANDAIERMVSVRGDLMRTISQMSVRLRKVLTPQQWQELQKRRPRMGPPQGEGPQAPRPFPGRRGRPDAPKGTPQGPPQGPPPGPVQDM